MGKLGESGDAKEIHHTTKLIKDYLEYVISFEERVRFVNVPQEYLRCVHLFENLIGSQVEKLSTIPSDLDEIVSLIDDFKEGNETPKTIQKDFIFALPRNWEADFSKEINKLKRKKGYQTNDSTGCLTTISIIIFVATLFFFI